jgi:hypothetical protein
LPEKNKNPHSSNFPTHHRLHDMLPRKSIKIIMPTSKTPLFDAALDAYYQDKKPGMFTCKESGEEFEVTPEEVELYRELHMPLPTAAPWIRLRRHRALLAGVDLFRRPQPDESFLISMYDPESPVDVFPQKDEWDEKKFRPLEFGRSLDPNQPFFDQWVEFSHAIPRPAISQDTSGERSEWSIYTIDPKDCYYTFGGYGSQHLNYADQTGDSQFCTDAFMCMWCEWMYDSTQCSHCSRVSFSENCENSMDLQFCYSCVGCDHCFGCANLRQKKYCFLNTQLTQKEYEKRLKKIDLKDGHAVEEWRTRIAKEVWNKSLHPDGYNPRSENVVAGDNVMNSKNVRHAIFVNEADRVYTNYCGGDNKNCTDISSSVQNEWISNAVYTVYSSECRMTNAVGWCQDVEYSELLSSSEHCFGCISLKHKKFCIFNKQYTEEEYWPLVDAIKTAMLARGEYGEFFPYRASTFAYNTSHANLMFPLTQEEATKLGSRWYGFEQERSAPASPIEELPFHLDEVKDDVLTKSFRCPISGRAFRIVKPELEFHRTMGLALPRMHPTERRKRRAIQNMPVKFLDRTCSVCDKPLKTRIPPSLPYPVACEECYAKYVANDEALI